jgi:hypothetical protein
MSVSSFQPASGRVEYAHGNDSLNRNEKAPCATVTGSMLLLHDQMLAPPQDRLLAPTSKSVGTNSRCRSPAFAAVSNTSAVLDF